MKLNRVWTSNILKILLVLFAMVIIFVGVYVLPTMAEEMSVIHPEIAYAKLPILLTCQLLLILLIIGMGIIMRLLIIFDRGLTFSTNFLKGVETLVTMCIAASIIIIILFLYLRSFGGPGPLLSLIMIGTMFIVWIVGSVIALIRAIVKQAIVYKNDYDLTV